MIVTNITDPKVRKLIQRLAYLGKITNTREFKDLTYYGGNCISKVQSHRVIVINPVLVAEEIQGILDTHVQGPLGGRPMHQQNHLNAIKYLKEHHGKVTT